MAGLALAPGSAEALAEKNHPSYWEDLGYGTCVKYESPGTPYTLGVAPAGRTWTMLVVKAGSESSTNDPHAEYPNPVPGPYYHPSGKSISHVIVCSRGGSSSTTTTSTSTPTDCGGYTPRQLATDKASVEPGESFTVTGLAAPTDELIVSISGAGVPTVVLGTTVAAADGSFSITVMVPDEFPAGNYSITVKSKACARTASFTIRTQSVNRSGCGMGNPFTLVRGQANSWLLVSGTPPFNKSKQVTLRLNQRGGSASYLLYSGSWPSSGTVTLNVPAAAPLDRYFLVQSGFQQGNNKSRTESCPLRVVDPPPPATSTTSTTTTTTTTTAGAAVGALLLLRLHRRRRNATSTH